MKTLKSSKILKPLDYVTKEQNILRSRIKLLEEQIDRLQQSNLNIYIPISEHTVQSNIDYKSIIAKLKSQVCNLQQQCVNQKAQIKKLQKEKDNLVNKHKIQINGLHQEIETEKAKCNDLQQQLDDLYIQVNSYKQKCQQMEKQLISKNIQIKFLNQDLQQAKDKTTFYINKYDKIIEQISAVKNGTKIYKSFQINITAIETLELNLLRSRIQQLQTIIRQLERIIREMQEANRQEKVSLGYPKSNIGEEIVRLKKNIDMQLGLNTNSECTESFLNTYNSTNQLFDKLIKQCKK